jgi:hypothetical protein
MAEPKAPASEMKEVGAKADGKEEDELKNFEMASISSLFQFATMYDVFLLSFGSLCSGAVGAAQPAMMLLFSELINSVGTMLGGNDVSAKPPVPGPARTSPRFLHASGHSNRTFGGPPLPPLSRASSLLCLVPCVLPLEP